MKMSRRLSIVILVLITTGCNIMGPTRWARPNTTQSEYQRDMYDCQAKNRTAHPYMLLVDMQNVIQCMEMEKGYTRERG